jgi:hypothetical protein
MGDFASVATSILSRADDERDFAAALKQEIALYFGTDKGKRLSQISGRFDRQRLLQIALDCNPAREPGQPAERARDRVARFEKACLAVHVRQIARSCAASSADAASDFQQYMEKAADPFAVADFMSGRFQLVKAHHKASDAWADAWGRLGDLSDLQGADKAKVEHLQNEAIQYAVRQLAHRVDSSSSQEWVDQALAGIARNLALLAPDPSKPSPQADRGHCSIS